MTPLPPPDLHERDPLIFDISPGALLVRFHAADRAPIYFDRGPLGRFNDPAGRFGALYAAVGREGAFAETFLREPGRTMIATDMLATKAYVEIAPVRAMRLIRLAGPGLARLGATAEIVHGGLPYGVPQAWSAALHGHPAQADGIAYHARHDDEALCCAIWDRAGPALAVKGREPDLDQEWFWLLADIYGVGLAPRS